MAVFNILNTENLRFFKAPHKNFMQKRQQFLIILILLCFSLSAFAQSRRVPNKMDYDLAPYHFGFLLGFNEMLFTIKTAPDYQKKMYYNNEFMQAMPDQNSDSAFLYNVEGTPTFGFVIGIVGNLRLGEYFDLRFTPSLTFGERNLDYSIKNFYDSPTPQMLFVTKNIQSTFVEFPLWVRFKGQRIHNMRPYVLAGAKYSLDLASNAKKKEDNSAANVFINRKDVYALGGVGFDFYTVYFKFGVELSMSYGIFDVLKHDNTLYTDAIENMNSKIFQVSFTFE
jgi:hypothetical protein